jgi:hypothetical protein
VHKLSSSLITVFLAHSYHLNLGLMPPLKSWPSSKEATSYYDWVTPLDILCRALLLSDFVSLFITCLFSLQWKPHKYRKLALLFLWILEFLETWYRGGSGPSHKFA